MTSPIALLLPMGGNEPATQPAPAEDPALFAAALQSAMVQAPTVPTVTTPAAPAEPATPQGEGQGTEAQPGEADAAGDAATSQTETSTGTQGSATMARGARDRGQRLTAAAAVKSASTAVVTAGPRIFVKNAGQAPRGAGGTRTATSLARTANGAVLPASVKSPLSPEAAVPDQRGAAAVVSTQSAARSANLIGRDAIPAAKLLATGTSEAKTGDLAASLSGEADLRVTTESANDSGLQVSKTSDGRTFQATAPEGDPSTVPMTPAWISVAKPRDATGEGLTRHAVTDAAASPSTASSSPVPAAATTATVAADSAAQMTGDHSAALVKAAESSRAVRAESSQREGRSAILETRPPSGESRSARRKSDAAAMETDSSHARDMVPPAAATPVVPSMAMPLPAVAPKGDAAEPRRDGADGGSTPAQDQSVAEAPAAVLSGDAPEASAATVPAGPSRGLAFAQELAALLGDAEIRDLKITVGARGRGAARVPETTAAFANEAGDVRPETATAPRPSPAPAPLPSNAPIVTANRPEAKTPQAEASGAPASGVSAAQVDDDLVALSTGTIPTPSGAVAGPRESAIAAHSASAARRGRARGDADAGDIARGTSPSRGESARVRVAEPVPQRAAALALPLDDEGPARSGATARAPILPASRQDLPPSTNREAGTVMASGREEARDTNEPSDSQGRASATVANLTESLSRAEPRSKEAAASEARNMPDRSETKDRPAGLADRVTLQVADAEGRETRIKVTVLGDQVRAVILPSDQESARHLERRMDDLQAALVRQGFADPKVSVQSPGTTGNQAAWAAAPGGAQADNASGRGKDQPAEDQGQGSGRQNQERGGDGQRHPQQRFRERDPDDRQNQDA